VKETPQPGVPEPGPPANPNPGGWASPTPGFPPAPDVPVPDAALPDGLPPTGSAPAGPPPGSYGPPQPPAGWYGPPRAPGWYGQPGPPGQRYGQPGPPVTWYGQPGPPATWYGYGAAEPSVASAPPGTRFDQLARTPLHRWWRPLLATLLGLMLWAGLGSLIVGIGIAYTDASGTTPQNPDHIFSDPLLELGSTLLVLALGIPLTLTVARWLQRRPPGSVVSVVNRVRWRWLAACMGVALPTILGTYALIVLLSGPEASQEAELGLGWVGWSKFLPAALMLLVLVPLQSAGEEFVFRGWVPQLFGAYLRSPYPGIVVSALLFALAHGLGTTWGFADLVLFGVVAGWLAIRTGGLEAPIALHAVNNLSAFLLAAASGQLDLEKTAADSPWQLFAADLVVLPLFAFIVVRMARRMQVPAVVPAPEPLPAGQSAPGALPPGPQPPSQAPPHAHAPGSHAYGPGTWPAGPPGPGAPPWPGGPPGPSGPPWPGGPGGRSGA
jgi:uncharacterized protein